MAVGRMTYWRTTDAGADNGVVAVLDTDIDEETINEVDELETAADLQADDEIETTPITAGEAEDAWAEEARQILAGVAGTYHQLLDHTDLANGVQKASGIYTSTNAHYWIGRVLNQVAAVNAVKGEPALTSLVVHRVQGTVGDDYDEVLRLAGEPAISDPNEREKHAAAARMECYRWAGAKMPDDGGNPALSPKLAQRITRERKRAREEAPPTVCPHCFMAVPPTGVCDNCG
jgi:hypothetical protein